MCQRKPNFTTVFLVLSVVIAVLAIYPGQETAIASTATSITGQVAGKNGAEAGVWVIAETDDLKTPYTKIVVTDDEGRFVLPEMPEATYDVWVRGYGLKDSTAVKAKPGDEVNFQASYPATPQEAAQIYPANYWHSLATPPTVDEFPGTGKNGNKITERITTQEAWIDGMKQHCQLCHQLGTKITREIDHWGEDTFESTREAWEAKLSLRPSMQHHADLMGHERLLDMYTDWTNSIAAGAVPPQPPRPKGVERNIVITMWDWGDEDTSMVHDVIVTDKRDPNFNAKGSLYGMAQFDGDILITDPNTHTSRKVKIPMREDLMEQGASGAIRTMEQGGGSDVDFANNHNHMFDASGRLWMTSSIRRQAKNPEWCLKGSDHPSAKYFPIANSTRHASYFDTETDKITLIDTCFVTHHLQFTPDENETLWFSGDQNVLGWIDTKKYIETGDEQASQSWCPTVLDTNQDGKITKPWNEPGEEIDPTRDTRIDALRRFGDDVKNEFIANFYYGIIPNPTDNSVWLVRPGPTPGALVRVDVGKKPPESCISEVYEPPFNNGKTARKDWGFGPRGIDVDTDGVIWTALSGSSHMASFDRRKCKITSGPTATGQHCPEGWTLYPAPGPKMKGTASAGSADFHYYSYVDQFNVFGLGKNTPMMNGTGSDSLLALDPETGKWVTIRVPYPMGFYTRGMDTRIDDPNAGWKGAALYGNYGQWPSKHMESKGDAILKVVKFQMRPSPLAK